MKYLLLILTLGLITQTSFAAEDEVMKFLNEKQELNLAIPADIKIESMQLVVSDKNYFDNTSTDTINKNILFS